VLAAEGFGFDVASSARSITAPCSQKSTGRWPTWDSSLGSRLPGRMAGAGVNRTKPVSFARLPRAHRQASMSIVEVVPSWVDEVPVETPVMERDCARSESSVNQSCIRPPCSRASRNGYEMRVKHLIWMLNSHLVCVSTCQKNSFEE
jgi:hypothetical protein